MESALSVSEADPPEHLKNDKGWMAGHALWLRTISSCQATLFLIEQGNAGPAWSTLRNAYECLFYACALWKDPSKFAKLEDNSRIQMAKQANGLLKPGVYDAMDAETRTILEARSTGGWRDGVRLEEWSIFSAAEDAGMEYEYQMVFRGSSLVGAHATERSTDAHFVEVSEGVHSFYSGPRFDNAEFQIGWVSEAIVLGLQAFKALHQLDQPHSPE